MNGCSAVTRFGQRCRIPLETPAQFAAKLCHVHDPKGVFQQKAAEARKARAPKAKKPPKLSEWQKGYDAGLRDGYEAAIGHHEVAS